MVLKVFLEKKFFNTPSHLFCASDNARGDKPHRFQSGRP